MTDAQMVQVLRDRKFAVHPNVQIPQVGHMRRIRWDNARVIELGGWDGRHSELALMLGAHSGVVVEENESHWNTPIDHSCNIEWIQEDVESWCPADRYDVAIVCGILYHMKDPVALLDKVRELSDVVFMWTHVANASDSEFKGYKGDMRRDTGGKAFNTFWFRIDELVRYWVEASWHIDLIVYTKASYPVSPAYTMILRKEIQ